jgi:hypothetical protein
MGPCCCYLVEMGRQIGKSFKLPTFKFQLSDFPYCFLSLTSMKALRYTKHIWTDLAKIDSLDFGNKTQHLSHAKLGSDCYDITTFSNVELINISPLGSALFNNKFIMDLNLSLLDHIICPCLILLCHIKN